VGAAWDVVAGAVDALMHKGMSKRGAASAAGSAAQRREHWALLCLRMAEVFPG